MGLAVIAYCDVTPWDELSESARDGRSPEEDGIRFQNDPAFADRLAPLEEGYYQATESHREYIGSYHYYGEWRTWLSRTFPSAFQELVDFSDSYGSLGPNAICSLRVDFEDWEERVRDMAETPSPDGDDINSYFETFQQFRRCFEAAGSDGVVKFS